MYPRYAQGHHLAGLDRRQAALEVEEALVRVGLELGQQRRRGAVEGAGQARHLVEVGGHFPGVAPDRRDFGGYRQRLAVAVGDHAAGDRDRQVADRAKVALVGEEFVVVDLEIDQPSGDGQGGEDEQGDDKDEAVVSALTAHARAHWGRGRAEARPGQC